MEKAVILSDKATRKATEPILYNGQIGWVTCRTCGRTYTVVLQDFTLMPHGRGRACRGPREGVFEDLLEASGLCAGAWRCGVSEAS